MTDSTLPPLSPSSVPDTRPSEVRDTASQEKDVYPFLVHSQESVTNGQPPEVDNGKLARQKRRRTSPEDQAILEAAYKENPKPDKAARMEIVSRVALGEKEVQIWFQNRRQNTRRKSRPLLPHEIAAFGLGGMRALSTDPASNNGTPNSSFSLSQSSMSAPPMTLNTPDMTGQVDASGLTQQGETSSSEPKLAGEASLPTITPLKASTSFSSETFDFPSSQGEKHNWLCNRFNATSSFSTPATTQSAPFITPGSFNSSFGPAPSSAPERVNGSKTSTPASNVRLSLSLEGKAELVPADHSSSPPRPASTGPNESLLESSLKRRSLGLQRSHSALAFTSSPATQSTPGAADRAAPAPFVPRLLSGRSRDARTWEFYADADARDELTTFAENEQSGSAVAAISLIRSTSGAGNALKSNRNKRNAPAPSTNGPLTESAKKKRILGHLQRAQSSVARLQTSTGRENVMMTPTKDSGAKDKRRKGEVEVLRSPGGDSDKENWLPGDENVTPSQSHNVGRRPLPSSARRPTAATPSKRPVLGSSRFSSQNSLTATGRNRGRNFKTMEHKIFEDSPGAGNGTGTPERERRSSASTEVELFMNGALSSPSKKGDLDCIQGLLSLSQGNWR